MLPWNDPRHRAERVRTVSHLVVVTSLGCRGECYSINSRWFKRSHFLQRSEPSLAVMSTLVLFRGAYRTKAAFSKSWRQTSGPCLVSSCRLFWSFPLVSNYLNLANSVPFFWMCSRRFPFLGGHDIWACSEERGCRMEWMFSFSLDILLGMQPHQAIEKLVTNLAGSRQQHQHQKGGNGFQEISQSMVGRRLSACIC